MKDTSKKYTACYQRFWCHLDARSTRTRPTMEKKDINSKERPNLNSARRKLFRDDDDDDDNVRRQNYNYVAAEMEANIERSKQKWNFDFVRGVPLTGQYEWVRVDRDGNESFVPAVNNVEENIDVQRSEQTTNRSTRRPRENDDSAETEAKRFKR